MAQTPQPEETGGAGGTTAPGAGRPQGLFGSSTTILLIIFAVAVFWWSRRRRVEMEERLRAQRQEAEATAERSALDVAHLMRAAPHSGAAAAAASQGLASAAPMPSQGTPGPDTEAMVDDRTTTGDDTPEHARRPLDDTEQDAYTRAIERAEAGAEAERAAEEQAERAARDAETAGESVVRRAAAAEAAAGEAMADTAEAEGSRPVGATPDAGADETRAAGSFGDGMRERGSDAGVPLGAVAGDGTANCPPDFPIKGNRQSRIYHRPGQGSYASTVAEFCFASEEAAEVAGFRASRARGQRGQP
jgi:hypothetical protein